MLPRSLAQRPPGTWAVPAAATTAPGAGPGRAVGAGSRALVPGRALGLRTLREEALASTYSRQGPLSFSTRGSLASRYRGFHSNRTACATATSTTPGSSSLPRKPLFDKILIANRGEIACRVIKTAKRLGIKTVAVYSEADRHAMHVQMADEAYLIGAPPSSDSYLRMDKIIQVAQMSGAKAIHPGYGFLSENAAFAQKLEKCGIVFIGPPAQAIIDMGSKSASKEIMSRAKVPVVPGYFGDNQDPALLKKEALKIQYPVLIKAVKGGGGKGMRIVEKPEDFDDMLESAKRESLKHFGDDRVLVEKYITRPRHVEVQVFGDKLGNYVYLFERDCSVQRRHQKIIEEAPAPHLSPEKRKSFGEKAVAAAKAVSYCGAGTVEFILDEDTGQFFFMEMNTRLQVEHPVTEMITRTDLVEWQLEVASGNRLPQLQADLKVYGWAFEARIYAENPANNFLPDTGPLIHYSPPTPSETVRVETGVRPADSVSVYYDPMISKLVVWGPQRSEALSLLRARLGEFEVVGLHTNIEFLKKLSAHPKFIAGEVDTGFIKRWEADLFDSPEVARVDPLVGAVLELVHAASAARQESHRTLLSQDPHSPWASLGALRINHNHSTSSTYETPKGGQLACSTTHRGHRLFDVLVEQKGFPSKQYTGISILSSQDITPSTPHARASADSAREELTAEIDGKRVVARVIRDKTKVTVFIDGKKTVLSIPPPPHHAQLSKVGPGAGSVKTPMPCKISTVLVKAGDTVKKGQVLIILEAMKMEHIIKSPFDGVVSKVHYRVGQLVEEGKSLVAFADEESK